MEWYKVSLNFLSSLAWPGVILTGILLFKPQLARLIDGIKEVSAAGISAKIEREAREIEVATLSLAGSVSGVSKVEESVAGEAKLAHTITANASLEINAGLTAEAIVTQSEDYQISVDQATPEVSSFEQIIRAWVQLEQNAKGLDEEMDLLPSKSPGNSMRAGSTFVVIQVVRELEKRGDLEVGTADLVKRLQSMRNQLVHNPDILSAKTADSILRGIREVARALLRIHINELRGK